MESASQTPSILKRILIEPIPELAEKCRRNRPNCSAVESALNPFHFDGESVKMHYSGLMSMVQGAMRTSFQETEHLKS